MKIKQTRTCLGCGGKFKQSELLRFSLNTHHEVVLNRGPKAPGRGVYSCKKRACLEVFLKSTKRLARAFRSEIIDGVTVVIDPFEIEKVLGSGSFR